MEEKDPFSREVIGAAIEVHWEMGPGLLEQLSKTHVGLRINFHAPVLKDGLKRLVL